jgi:hypothetical protein
VAAQVFTDTRIYAGGYDWSGDHNQISIDNPAAEVDARVFTNTAGKTLTGQYSPKVSGQGILQFGTGTVNDAIRTYQGVAGVPLTVSPQSGAVSDDAIFLKALQTKYQVGGKVNDALPFTLDASAQNTPAVCGKVFIAAGNKTSTSTSAIIQLGAVSSTQRVYAALHVLSASGTLPTLDVVVKSAALVGFGSPTTRLTFTQQTALGYDWQQTSVAAITDAFWRVDYTIGGTGSPTFSFVVVVGIFF